MEMRKNSKFSVNDFLPSSQCESHETTERNDGKNKQKKPGERYQFVKRRKKHKTSDDNVDEGTNYFAFSFVLEARGNFEYIKRWEKFIGCVRVN